MKSFYFPFLFASLFLISCEVSKPLSDSDQISTTSQKHIGPDFSSPHPGAYAVMWHQNSGEYKALCIQAFQIAKERLTRISEQNDEKEYRDPVVIVDIDETILDNSPYFGRLVLNNEVFTDESWKEWTGMQAAKYVPGAKDFLEHADKLGFPVYFLSNRDEIEIESTMLNLQKLGNENLSSESFLFKGKDRDKTFRRNKIATEHDIVLLIGDNLLDFTEAFADFEGDDLLNQEELIDKIGQSFIVLPNAMYGEWLYDKSDSGLAGDELTEPGIRFRKSRIRSY